MVTDYDWELLNKRLESIECSIEMLKAMQPVKEGTITAHSSYALKEGSLSDAGTVQVWNNNHKLADCISTTKLEE
jgi:hypothetical protein